MSKNEQWQVLMTEGQLRLVRLALLWLQVLDSGQMQALYDRVTEAGVGPDAIGDTPPAPGDVDKMLEGLDKAAPPFGSAAALRKLLEEMARGTQEMNQPIPMVPVDPDPHRILTGVPEWVYRPDPNRWLTPNTPGPNTLGMTWGTNKPTNGG